MSPETLHWLVAGGSAAVVAATGGMLTELGPWYYRLRQPSWKPPDWLFAPAWTTIFVCCAIAGVIAYEAAPDAAARWRIVGLFALNGLLNMAWSMLFFRLKRPDWAFAEVIAFWLSIAALLLALWPLSSTAGLLIVPYLVWVSFAAVLNLAIVRLNR